MISLLLLLLSPGPTSAQVNVFPSGKFVTIPEANATFICFPLSGTIVSVEWLIMINHTRFQYQNLRNVEAEFSDIGSGLGALHFTGIPLEYNMTMIRCRAELNAGQTLTSNDATILLLQGLLSAVGLLTLSAENSTISLTWTAPFSLDIDGVVPDIEGYCITVTNYTSSLELDFQCGINETAFSYPAPPLSWCYGYLFAVTPINIVGAGNRATKLYEGSAESSPQILEVLLSGKLGAPSFLFLMSDPVCSCEVMVEDLDTGDIKILQNGKISIVKDTIAFDSASLTSNRHYNVTIRATNIVGSALSSAAITTHDVFSAAVAAGDQTELATIYSSHSDATGALFSFVFITESGDVDFTRSALLALDRNTSHNHTLPFNLYPGHYRVYVYDIEHDGTLSSGMGYPAVRNELALLANQVTTNEPLFSLLESCYVSSSFNLIEVGCTPRSGSLAGVQVIVQLNELSEVHKLYVNQSTDLQTPVTVLVERAGGYQVSVFAIREGTGILGTQLEYADLVTTTLTTTTEDAEPKDKENTLPQVLLYTAFGTLLLILVGAILVSTLVCKCCCKRNKVETPDNRSANGESPEMERRYRSSSDVTTMTHTL